MHLFSNDKPETAKYKKPCVRIQAVITNPDGSATIGDYVAPPSVGTIDDFSIENLQNAGVGLTEINEAYLHKNFVDMDAMLATGASKLVSEAEVKELNNLE